MQLVVFDPTLALQVANLTCHMLIFTLGLVSNFKKLKQPVLYKINIRCKLYVKSSFMCFTGCL
jgi:hypothetical protein